MAEVNDDEHFVGANTIRGTFPPIMSGRVSHDDVLQQLEGRKMLNSFVAVQISPSKKYVEILFKSDVDSVNLKQDLCTTPLYFSQWKVSVPFVIDAKPTINVTIQRAPLEYPMEQMRAQFTRVFQDHFQQGGDVNEALGIFWNSDEFRAVTGTLESQFGALWNNQKQKHKKQRLSSGPYAGSKSVSITEVEESEENQGKEENRNAVEAVAPTNTDVIATDTTTHG